MVDGMGDANPADEMSSAEEARQAHIHVEHDVTEGMHDDVIAGSAVYQTLHKAG
jgi:hypothetical protein